MASKNINKKTLINKVYQNLGFSKNFTSKLIDNFFEILSLELINTKKVKVSSFGTLQVISKKEREGRNPKTKIKAKISARKVVKFTPSAALKKKINFDDNE